MSATTTTATTGTPGSVPRHVFARLLRRPGGWAGASIIAILVLMAVFAPLIAPYAPGAQDIGSRLEGPTWDHLLGTDELGRDTLSRAIYGARVALRVSIPAVFIAMLIGLVLGLLAGYFGKTIDAIVVVFFDSLQSFPAMILALALLAVVGPSLTSVTIVIALAFIPNYGRVTRAQVLVAKHQVWVDAERSIGARLPRLLFLHVVPNIMTPLWVILAMDIPSAIGIEAGLSFLGLGVPPPMSSWGVLLADGFANVYSSPWGIISASAFLMVTTFGFTALGEAIRDTLDPRNHGGSR